MNLQKYRAIIKQKDSNVYYLLQIVLMIQFSKYLKPFNEETEHNVWIPVLEYIGHF